MTVRARSNTRGSPRVPPQSPGGLLPAGTSAGQVPVWDGTQYVAENRPVDIQGVSGSQQVSVDVFTRVGSLYVDPSQYPNLATITLEAVLNTTINNAELQLYNVTDGAVVAGSLLTTASTTSVRLTAALALPASGKLYEVQLRMDVVGGATDAAVCTEARIILS